MSSSPSQRSGPTEIVILIHGIRTEAVWEDLVARELRTIQGFDARPISYGYLDTFRFWFPYLTRRQPLQRIHREIRAIKQAHPDSRISIIAHSFGTYGIARVLEEYPDIHLRRLVLCGSIVPRAFRWDKISSRQLDQPVINDCGERDVWPLLAQSLSFGYGASGTLGFGSANVIDRFHPFTHSQFFGSEFITRYWVSLFADDRVVFPSNARTGGKWWQRLLARLRLQWVAIAVTLVAATLLLRKTERNHSVPAPSEVVSDLSDRSADQINATLAAPIYFMYDRTTPGTDYGPLLAAKAQILAANPRFRVRLEGNTTERGSDEYLLAQGQREAAAVKHLLVANGLSPDRVDLVSYGEERPAVLEYDSSRSTQFGWHPNRRVDVRLIADTPTNGDSVELLDPHRTDRIARIKTSRRSLRLTRGQRLPIYGLAYNSRGSVITSAPVSYFSSDDNVATVDSTGVVTAIGVGRSRIDVRAGAVTDTIGVLVREERLIFDPNVAQPGFRSAQGKCNPQRVGDETGGYNYVLVPQDGSSGLACSVVLSGAGIVQDNIRLEWSSGVAEGKDMTGFLGVSFWSDLSGRNYHFIALRGAGLEDHQLALFRHTPAGDELLVPWLGVGFDPSYITADFTDKKVTVYVDDQPLFDFPAPQASGHIGIVRRGSVGEGLMHPLVYKIVESPPE